jgi:outer membrane protein assembly factor BamB
MWMPRAVAARAARVLTITAVLTSLAAACSTSDSTQSSGGALPSRSLSPGAVDSAGPAAWSTFDQNSARSGPATGVAAASGKLSVAWHARLDGAVYGQPLVIGHEVVAATENDSVYALNETTGKVVWRIHLGTPVPLSALPCGNIDPLGITGTPVYNRANGLIYVLAEVTGYHHVLFGLSAGNGKVTVERDIPAPDGHPRNDQQRPALTISGGRVYVAFGGLYGDCGQYQGSIVGVPLSGSGRLIKYVVPTARMGAIWGPAGPVIGANGTLYVSTGNGAATGGTFDGSDSVTSLTPALTRTGIFAPASWGSDNAGDRDLGSASPVLLPGGRLLAVGKSGTGYLLNASRLGGVGGQLAQGPVCAVYGAAATASGDTAYEPCQSGGMAAVRVTGASINVLWRGPSGASGSVTLGGGAVWVTDPGSGKLYELNPGTGSVRAQIGLGSDLSHFAPVSLAGNLAFTPTLDGVTAVRGA